MNQRTTLLTGVLFCGLAVALGAFGAHAFKPILIANQKLETYELAVRYQFYHGFALLFLGLLMDRVPVKHRLGSVGWSWAIGILFFSGSLYALCFSTMRAVVYFTPIGGLLFLAGWTLLFLSLIRNK